MSAAAHGALDPEKRHRGWGLWHGMAEQGISGSGIRRLLGAEGFTEPEITELLTRYRHEQWVAAKLRLIGGGVLFGVPLALTIFTVFRGAEVYYWPVAVTLGLGFLVAGFIRLAKLRTISQ